MDTLLIIVLVVLLIGVAVYFSQSGSRQSQVSLDDAKAEARRWIERLGGQVLSLDAKGNQAARQALSDASERYTAAGSQIEQANSVRQAQLAQHTAYEGLYYVRAARTTLGLDPGPEIPPLPGQQQAGAVTEERKVDVAGHDYRVSPRAGDHTRYYYPGGTVAGRPVPRGWYSERWWQPALTTGAWVAGSYLIGSALFAGMAGMGAAAGWGGDAGAWGDGGADGMDAGGMDGMDAEGMDGMDMGGFDF